MTNARLDLEFPCLTFRMRRGQHERALSGWKSWNNTQKAAAGRFSAVTHCCNISGHLIRQRMKSSQLRGATLWERRRAVGGIPVIFGRM